MIEDSPSVTRVVIFTPNEFTLCMLYNNSLNHILLSMTDINIKFI